MFFSLTEQERRVRLEVPSTQPFPSTPAEGVPSSFAVQAAASISTKGQSVAAFGVIGSSCSGSSRVEDTNTVKGYLKDLIKPTQVKAL